MHILRDFFNLIVTVGWISSRRLLCIPVPREKMNYIIRVSWVVNELSEPSAAGAYYQSIFQPSCKLELACRLANQTRKRMQGSTRKLSNRAWFTRSLCTILVLLIWILRSITMGLKLWGKVFCNFLSRYVAGCCFIPKITIWPLKINYVPSSTAAPVAVFLFSRIFRRRARTT